MADGAGEGVSCPFESCDRMFFGNNRFGVLALHVRKCGWQHGDREHAGLAGAGHPDSLPAEAEGNSDSEEEVDIDFETVKFAKQARLSFSQTGRLLALMGLVETHGKVCCKALWRVLLVMLPPPPTAPRPPFPAAWLAPATYIHSLPLHCSRRCSLQMQSTATWTTCCWTARMVGQRTLSISPAQTFPSLGKRMGSLGAWAAGSLGAGHFDAGLPSLRPPPLSQLGTGTPSSWPAILPASLLMTPCFSVPWLCAQCPLR